MSVSDDILDGLIQWNVDLQRGVTARQAITLLVLKELYKDLRALLRKIDPTEPKYDAVRHRRLQQLALDAADLIRRTYTEIAAAEHDFHVDVAALAQRAVKTSFGAAIGADIMSISLAPDFLESLVDMTQQEGLPASDWWRNDGLDLGRDFYATMRQGLLRGETITELTARVKPLEPKYNIRAETLVRTFAVGTSNNATMSTYYRNRDVVRGLVWVATLDTRTSEICRRLDGRQWRIPEDGGFATLNNYEPVGHSEPFPGASAHFNERSTQGPVVVPFRQLPPEKRRRVPPETRASMDGAVPAEIRYYDWLAKQPASRIKEVLGNTRYKLMRENKLDLTDLLDMRGNPLPVADLVEKYGPRRAA